MLSDIVVFCAFKNKYIKNLAVIRFNKYYIPVQRHKIFWKSTDVERSKFLIKCTSRRKKIRRYNSAFINQFENLL